MKVFKYQIDLERLNLAEAEKKEVIANKQKALFENTLNAGLHSKYPNGIKGALQRTYGRLLDKLDKTSDSSIDLEEAEFDILKDIFLSEDVSFPANAIRIINLYADAVEGAIEK